MGALAKRFRAAGHRVPVASVDHHRAIIVHPLEPDPCDAADMKQLLKRLVLPSGRRLRRLRGGIARGMLMELDLAEQSQRYFGLDERELLGVAGNLIARARSLVDVGANDGYYTMAFLRSAAERVVACEPGPTMERLLANAAANGYAMGARFTVERRFVGRSAGNVTIGELLAGLPRPVLVKVDVDGGELELLRSAEGPAPLEQVRWLIETHSLDLEVQCDDWLRSHGYRTRIIRNAGWRRLLPERRPISHNRWLLAERPDDL